MNAADFSAVDTVARHLVSARHALWLGAGVSVESGVPTASPLRLRILRGLGLNDEDIAYVEYANLPFESFFEVLLGTADCKPLLEVFRGSNPSLGHKVAAELAKRGLVGTILTTNFDSLLENSLEAQKVPFYTYASEASFPTIDWSSAEVRVIKLHGTITDTNELALTIRRVAARQRAEIRGRVVNELIERDAGSGVLILGYSCSDHFDISPAARMASRKDKRIWYVSHNDSIASPSISPLCECHPSNPFSGFDALCVTCATDELLRSMWRVLSGDDPPIVEQTKSEWPAIVDRWLDRLDLLEGNGRRTYIGGLVLKAANQWKRSNELLDKAIKQGLTSDAVPRALLAIGNNLRDLGDFANAEITLTRAAGLARQVGSVQSEARILNSIGIISEDRGEHDKAIALYNHALALARRAEDRELEGKCHGNLGIAYKNRGRQGDLLGALTNHIMAQQVALEIGDKRSEGRTLGNIGLIYREQKEFRIACRYYEDARKIAESLGDFLHVGIWLHNAGEDLADSDPTLARNYLQQSHEIFSRLGQEGFARQSAEALECIEARLRE